ncbi:MAG: phosphoribosylaminoimidazolesuccinocarboxamide synthase [Chloroflexi bacterium]|nr:MAG: phosphoribosylaminoimidazolesuccinocarboxamide synthase [Chloroflexota bacterium]
MTAPGTTLTSVEVQGLAVFRRGKVRDTFELGDRTLLMVATDRISAFDVVLPTPIPDKGAVLTQMSRWWFARTADVVPNHLRDDDPTSLPAAVDWNALRLRSMRVARGERVDIECVVRGHLSGSGWREYREQGTLAGEPLPAGLAESARLAEPRFTPAIKSDDGHDENISRAQLAGIVGTDLARRLEDASLRLFAVATPAAEAAGLILADTKFEFGWIDGRLCVIDEMLTPDSSRYWEASQYREGTSQPSFDKQFVRDYLETLTWDKRPPGPELPDEVVSRTREKYLEAMRRLCGITL